MTSIQKDGKPNQAYKFMIDSCPEELLKSVQNLKKMGITQAYLELQFNTIDQTELFTHILNREQQEQIVANQLKTTYFHNIRGKIRRIQLTKNQEFQCMKKIKFNSAYHVALFLKYFVNRIAQIQNQYKYYMTGSKDGHLHIYINQAQISKMFLNEIRDMKKRLQFLEIRIQSICQRFIYSQKIGRQLNKLCIFHQIWYKGRQCTMIFYSEKYNLQKMKSIVEASTKHHITILKMVDQRFSFLLNYLMFKIFSKAFLNEIESLRSIQKSMIQFNQNKFGIVIHDMHEVFTEQIKFKVLQKAKNYFLMSFKAKNARKFYNTLKKEYLMMPFLNFNYSKKNVCLCIDVLKIDQFQKLKQMFRFLGESIDQQSQITVNWFHLQQDQLNQFRRNLVQNLVAILSASKFHIQNFQKLYQGKDLKCILKYKNFMDDKCVIEDDISTTLVNLIKIWCSKQNIDYKKQKQNLNIELQPYKKCYIQTEQIDKDQSNSEQQSQYSSEQPNQKKKQKSNLQSGNNNNRNQSQLTLQSQIYTKFKQLFANGSINKVFQSFNQQQGQLWKTSKSLNCFEQFFIHKTKIQSKIKSVAIHNSLKQHLKQYAQAHCQNFKQSIYMDFILNQHGLNKQRQQFINSNINMCYCQVSDLPNDLKWKDGLQELLFFNVEGLQIQRSYLGCENIDNMWLVPLFSIKTFTKNY